MPMPRRKMPQKFCEHCEAPLQRKRFNGRLEDPSVYLRRRFCGRSCAHVGMRKSSPSLAALRKRSERFRGNACETCGTELNLQVHHKNLDPADNKPENIQTLCASCHTRWHWQHGKLSPRSVWLAKESRNTTGSRRAPSRSRRADHDQTGEVVRSSRTDEPDSAR